MTPQRTTQLAWLFRIAVCLEYVGHGAFGIITKKGWVPYFGVVGIPEPWAWKLMPVVGAVDIFIGCWLLARPCRAALLYAAVWGLWTALLRPLSGEPLWETMERAGNYGVPLAFLLATTARGWFAPIEMRPMERPLLERLSWVLRLTTGLLLIGHGAFGAVLQKPQLVQQLHTVGLPLVPIAALGGFECALGLAVLLRPTAPLLLLIFGWKIVTELLYPFSGAPMWEFIERAGSYAAPLALFWIMAPARFASPTEVQTA